MHGRQSLVLAAVMVLVGLLSPAFGQSDSTTKGQEVLARIRDFIAPGGAFDNIRDLEVTSSGTMILGQVTTQGRFRSLYIFPNRHREELQVPAVALVQYFDGSNGWIEQNGKRKKMDNKARKVWEATMFCDPVALLRGGGQYAVKYEERRGDQDVVLLSRGELWGRLFVNADGKLTDIQCRVSTTGTMMSQSFSDWAQMSGFNWPRHVVLKNDSQTVMDVMIDTVRTDFGATAEMLEVAGVQLPASSASNAMQASIPIQQLSLMHHHTFPKGLHLVAITVAPDGLSFDPGKDTCTIKKVTIPWDLVDKAEFESRNSAFGASGTFLTVSVRDYKPGKFVSLRFADPGAFMEDGNVFLGANGEQYLNDAMNVLTQAIEAQRMAKQDAFRANSKMSSEPNPLPQQDVQSAPPRLLHTAPSVEKDTSPVELNEGQTPEEVEKMLGKPEDVTRVKDTLIYTYPAVKAFFESGKLVNIEERKK